MNRIYLDNAAAARTEQAALESFIEVCRCDYGNPSALHEFGLEAEKIITACKKTVLGQLNAEATHELIFTSGATESNNLAIFGCVKRFRNKRVITAKTEHPSVAECFKELAERGMEVVYLNKLSAEGEIDYAELEEAVNGDTVLVSLNHVNNETGLINDTEKIGRFIKARNKNVFFHVDAAQSFGKLLFDAERGRVDLISLSAHKMGGVKGVGALAARKGVTVQPLMFGGKQQKGLRPGTENTCGIAAFDTAAKLAAENMSENLNIVRRLNDYTRAGLLAIGGVIINSGADASPYILNASFPGLKSETLLHALEEAGIFISAGSACSSKAKASAVLTACGLSRELIESSARVSFSRFNTLDECEAFIAALKKILPVIARRG
jgi:cysteine desulfurase